MRTAITGIGTRRAVTPSILSNRGEEGKPTCEAPHDAA